MPALGGGPGRKAGRRWETLTEERTGWGKAGALSRRRAAAGQAGPVLPLSAPPGRSGSPGAPPRPERHGAADPEWRPPPPSPTAGGPHRPTLGSAERGAAPPPGYLAQGSGGGSGSVPGVFPPPSTAPTLRLGGVTPPLRGPAPARVNQRCRGSAPAPVASRPRPPRRRRLRVGAIRVCSVAAPVGGERGREAPLSPSPPRQGPSPRRLSAAAPRPVPSVAPICLPRPPSLSSPVRRSCQRRPPLAEGAESRSQGGRAHRAVGLPGRKGSPVSRAALLPKAFQALGNWPALAGSFITPQAL